MSKLLTKEELDEKLCNYCSFTDFGLRKVNTNSYDQCEGFNCDSAYENYLDDISYEIDKVRKQLKKLGFLNE